MKLLLTLTAAVAATTTTPAMAVTDFTASFDPIVYSGSSSGTVVFDVTILNTGTDNIFGPEGGSGLTFDDFEPYWLSVNFGPDDSFDGFGNQFSGLELAPGESFSFSFANLTYAGAPDGTYNFASDSFISLIGASRVITSRSIAGPAQVIIATASAVPEPATWAMMLLGFGFVGGVLRSNNRRQKVTVSYA